MGNASLIALHHPHFAQPPAYTFSATHLKLKVVHTNISSHIEDLHTQAGAEGSGATITNIPKAGQRLSKPAIKGNGGAGKAMQPLQPICPDVLPPGGSAVTAPTRPLVPSSDGITNASPQQA